MEDRGGGQGTFNERAALEELERLREEIEQRRAAREAAAGRFDAFIRSFQAPSAPPPVDAAASTPSSPQVPVLRPPAVPPQTVPPWPDTAPPPQAAPPRPVEAPPPDVEEAVPSLAGPPPAAPGKKRQRTRALMASALLLPAVGALGFWAWRQQVARVAVATPDAAVQRSADPPDTRPTKPPTDRPAVVPAVPAEAPAATQLEIEVTTTRSVWVRVLSDGVRVLERELPAEARVPVTAKQAIVIRAGDAGAVQVSVGGGERQPLGPVGQPITRTFAFNPR